MKDRFLTTVVTLALVVAAASAAFALTPMWELKTETSHPQSVTIQTPDGDLAYWYVVYTVKNQHDEPKAMRPVATLAGNMGSVRRDVYEPRVLEAAEKRIGFMPANVANAACTLKAGEARECVAVFNMPDRDSSKLTLGIYGLAGKRIEKQDGQTGIASRLYRVEHSITGDRYNFTPDRLKVVSKGFVNSFRAFEGEGVILGEAPDGRAVKLPDSAGPVTDVPAVGAVSGGAERVATADPLDLLPGGVKGMGYVNIKQLVDVGLIDQVFKLAGEQGVDPNAQLEALGLDPKKDLDALAFVVGDFTAPEPNGAIVVTGKFDTDAIRNAIEKKAGDDLEIVEYKGYSLMGSPGGQQRLCVLDGKALAVGTEDFVKKIADIHKGDAEAGAKASPLMARARDLGDRTFWIVADVKIPPVPEDQAGMMAMALPGFDPAKLNGVTVAGKVTEEAFNLKITLGCEDEDSAAGTVVGFKQGVNWINGMANMFTQEDPESGKALGELIRAIEIIPGDTSATIDLTITAELAEKLKTASQKMAGALMMMQGAGGAGGAMEPDGDEEPIDWGEEE